MSSSGCRSESQSRAAGSAQSASTLAWYSASSASTAGTTWRGSIERNSGSSAAASRGLVSVMGNSGVGTP